MKSNIAIKILMATALLILAIPVVASAQIYRRSYEYDRNDRRVLSNRRRAVFCIQSSLVDPER